MQDREQDRTEQATPFKLEESRKRGEVQRSIEVASFMLVLGLLLALLLCGGTVWERLCRTATALFEAAPAGDLAALVGLCVRGCLELTLPFAAAGMVLVLLGGLLQTGPIFTFQPLQPRFERIDPLKGFRKLFGKRILFEAIKSTVKVTLLGGVAYLFFSRNWPRLVVDATTADAGPLIAIARLGIALLERLAVALLVIAVLDVVFVRWQYRRQMMMSRRELKEEIRRREGDPRVRARQRELQREGRKQSKSLAQVRDADVLITNPDHVGVALRYDRAQMSAPHIVAKGAGLWVLRMRLLAWRYSVPVREQRLLARHLFRHGAIDRPIPPESYIEVARLYADLGLGSRRAEGRYEVRA
jgi:flagellar biosynthetic protein FlhB